MDLYEAAKALQIIDVWQNPNPTGWVTPRILYDPSVKKQNGKAAAPTLSKYVWWMDHGTVGVNTLRFWGEGGSINNGTYSLAQYLVPRDSTVYADGQPHDTSNVVFKMVPDGFACNHTGECIVPIGNHNTKGVEYESRQNGTHDITEMQYVKGALIYAYDTYLKTPKQDIKDWFRIAHGIAAVPWTRRSDPWAGLFRIGYSWKLVEAIRDDPRIRQLWGFP